MSERDNVVSIGDDYRRYSRKFWGTRDRERAAREEQQAAALTSWGLSGTRPLAPDHVMAWNDRAAARETEQRRRRLETRRLEIKHGLRPPDWI
jgi:hypothetical protein